MGTSLTAANHGGRVRATTDVRTPWFPMGEFPFGIPGSRNAAFPVSPTPSAYCTFCRWSRRTLTLTLLSALIFRHLRPFAPRDEVGMVYRAHLPTECVSDKSLLFPSLPLLIMTDQVHWVLLE